MRRTLALVLVMLLALVCNMAAQEVTGTIVGTVKDVSGSVVPNATVAVTNTDKNIVVRTVTTNASGDYAAPLLPIGHYSIEVTAPSFKKVVRSNIELNVSDRLTHNFALEVGAASETVTVESDAVAVELQSAAATGLITGTEVRQLSLNNRNYEQLVALQPGVTYGGGDQLYIGTSVPSGAANTVSFSLNGARNSANNWTVDGADNVDRGSNLTLLNYPSVDAIAEFKVLRGLYSAEYGRGAGQVNVITRSGQSAFHGDAYEFWRNDAISANDYFRKRSSNEFTKNHPAPLRYHNFGYTIGGPVYIPGLYNEKKDKTFFFFSQEYRRIITYTTQATTLPTLEERQGIFQYPVLVNGTTLPAGTQLNPALINPVAKAYLQDLWTGVQAPDDPLSHSANISVRNKFNHRQELARVDHVFGPKLSVFGRFLNDTIPTEEPFGLFSTGTYVPGVATSKSDNPGRSWVFRGTSTLTPTLLLEAGYSYSYGAHDNEIIGKANLANSPNIAAAIQGILPYSSSLNRIPTITGAYSTVGGYGPWTERNRDHNIFGNLSWMKGKHNFRFGGTWHAYSKTENAGSNNAGTFTIDSTGAIIPGGTSTAIAGRIRQAQAWANFLTGTISQFSQVSQDLTPFIRMKQFEAFAQDEWRITPRLTLSYGVRYSYFPQPYNDNDQVLSNFDPSTYDPAKAVAINPANGLIVVDAAGNPTQGDIRNGLIYASGSLANSPYGNKVGESTKGSWAPRLGIAYDPFGDGKTSIRAGYGLFYQATLVGTYEQAMFGNPPYSATLNLTGGTLSNPAAGTAVVSAVPLSLRGVQTSSDIPYTQQWSVDVQRQLGGGFMIDVGYYGSKDTHLLGIVDLNQPEPGAYVAAGISTTPLINPTAANPNPVNNVNKINAIRPYKGYGSINTIVPWFTGNYNSLQTSVEKRFSGASIVKVNYTWSKALTTSMSDRSNAPANIYDLMQNYGPSLLDRTHVLTGSYVYELPFMRDQKGVVGHLLGGWQTSGILSVATGLPLNVSGNLVGGTSTDAAGQGCILSASTCPIRPNMIADPNHNAPHSIAQWFNTGAFAANTTPGQVSTARSGAIRGPGYWRVDMSLFKQVKFTEQVGMQLRLETFNVLNHENYNTVNTSFGNTLFGQVTGSRDPRIIQLGAKVNF